MKQILILAYKLLVNDKGKYTALLVGTTFSVFLIVQMTSSFAGILTKASATVINVGGSMWVMDPAVNAIQNSVPMPDYVLDAVRSINGVKFAVPLYSGAALVKLRDGIYQPVTVIGLDDTSLFGRPELLEGNIDDIFAENGFIVGFGCAPAQQFDGAARSIRTAARCGFGVRRERAAALRLSASPYRQAIARRTKPPTNSRGLGFEEPQLPPFRESIFSPSLSSQSTNILA
jgi:hypothetical protein